MNILINKAIISLLTAIWLFLNIIPLNKSNIEKELGSSNGNYTYIQWLGEIPSKDHIEKSEKLSNRFVNLVIGQSKIEIQKPLNIIANNSSVMIADQGNQSILEFVKSKSHLLNFSKDYGKFPSIVGISFLPGGILFSDSKLNKVYKADFSDHQIQVLNDKYIFEQPTGVAYSGKTGDIWVVETKAHRICILDKKGNFIKTVGNRGSAPGEFNYPTSIWIDENGLVYIVDSLNFRIQIFSAEGELISVFGKQGDASGYFARPKGVATDSHGNIYVVDGLFNAVQVFDKEGQFLYYFGSQGKEKEQFWLPSGIFIDEEDVIYIADSYNARIQIFKLVKDQK